MKDYEAICKVAVVQAAPVLFDKKATLDKTVNLIRKAGEKGANLIVFPEAFIPAYPRGFSYGFVVGSRTMEGLKHREIAALLDLPLPTVLSKYRRALHKLKQKLMQEEESL